VVVSSALTSSRVSVAAITAGAVVLSSAISGDKTVESARVDASSKLNDLSTIDTSRGSIRDTGPEVVSEEPLEGGVGAAACGAVRLFTAGGLGVSDVGMGILGDNHAV